MTILAVSPVPAYMIGVSVSVVLVLIAALISKSISFQPDLSDVKKRKTWFWILASLTPVLTFLISFLAIYININAPNQQDKFMAAMGISAVISPVVYIVLGFVAAKANKNGKLGNWF